MHARTTILAVLTVLLLSGPAFAQDVPPALPIQGLPFECEPVLDTPVSGTDTFAWLGDPSLNFDDMDQDGHSNMDELAATSDPTLAKSTPFDHDGDGVPYSHPDPNKKDPCDWDPSVPARIVIEVVCVASCESPSAVNRQGQFNINAAVRNAAQEPVDPNSARVLCDIEHQALGPLGPQGNRINGPQDISLVRQSVGVYQIPIAVASGNFSGAWFVACSIEVGAAPETFRSNEARIDVLPIEFVITMVLDRPGYIQGEDVFVRAFPSEIAQNEAAGEAVLTVSGPNGEPIAEETMTWNSGAFYNPVGSTALTGAWEVNVTRPLGDIRDDLSEGPWTFEVSAEDGAPGAPNTGENSHVADVLNSVSLHEITVAMAGTTDLLLGRSLVGVNDTALPLVDNKVIERGSTLAFQGAYLFRGVPSNNGTITVQLMSNSGGAWTTQANPPVTRGPTSGAFTAAFTVPIGAPSGDWRARAFVRNETSDEIDDETGDLVFSVVRTTVDVVAGTDKAVYSQSTLAPPANPIGEIDEGANNALSHVGPVLLTPTRAPNAGAAAADDLRRGVNNASSDPVDQPREIVEITARTVGSHAGDGVASFSLYLEPTVPVPQETNHVRPHEQHEFLDRSNLGAPIILDVPMALDECHNAQCNFTGFYEIQPLDPAGRWVIVVRYFDLASRSNKGEATSVFVVQRDEQTPLPPQIEITHIQNIPTAGRTTPIALDEQVWAVRGNLTLADLPDGDPSPFTSMAKVWVRIQASDLSLWRQATLNPDSTWSVSLPSQDFYEIEEDGRHAVQAFAVVDPTGTATTPNAPFDIFGLPTAATLPVGGIYSNLDTELVDLDFPDRPIMRLAGIVGPDGTTVGNGSVLWNGVNHTLRGQFNLTDSAFTSAGGGDVLVHVRRVQYDNCAPTLLEPRDPYDLDNELNAIHGRGRRLGTFDENNAEWCLREEVTTYDDGAGGQISGFNLLAPPSGLASRASVDTTDPAKLVFSWNWDIRDVLASGDNQVDLCDDGILDDTLVQTNESLVRRVNSRFDGVSATTETMKTPDAGGAGCHALAEQLDNGASLEPWMRSVLNATVDASKGLPGDFPGHDESYYWVWLEVRTNKGFAFEQTRPDTAQDLPDDAAVDSPRALAESPALADAKAAVNGVLPSYDAIQLRYKPYPLGRIEAIEGTTPLGEAYSFDVGEGGFRLYNATRPVTIVGSVTPLGNAIDYSQLHLRAYLVDFDNCVRDHDNEGSNSDDGFDNDGDGEWCVLHEQTLAIEADDFSPALNPAATAGTQTFRVTWTPTVPAGVTDTGNWWLTPLVRTADGDDVEYLPPLADTRGWPDQDDDDVFDRLSFNWLHKAEQLCTQATCLVRSDETEFDKQIAFEPGLPGSLGNNYTGAVLNRTQPNLTVLSVSDLYLLRTTPDAPYGPSCAWTNATTDGTACDYDTTHDDVYGDPVIILGNIRNDTLRLNLTATPGGSFENVTRFEIEQRTVGYSLDDGELDAVVILRSQKATLDARTGTVLDGAALIAGVVPRAPIVVTPSAFALGYQDRVGLLVNLNASSFPETNVADARDIPRLTAALGAARPFMYNEITVRAFDDLGRVSEQRLLVNVDRLSLASTRLVSAAITHSGTAIDTTDPLFAGHEIVDGKLVPRYSLSGNVNLSFVTSYADGGAFGNDSVYASKLAALDVATGLLGPEMEFAVAGTWSNGGPLDRAIPGVGPAPSEFLIIGEETPVVGEMIFPLHYCPNDPTDVAGETGACTYDGTGVVGDATGGATGSSDGSGMRFDSITVFYLPLRVGVNPPFVRITATDPWDPTTWKPEADPGDTAFGADLSAQGRFIAREGGGEINDPNWAYNSLEFMYVAFEGDLDPNNLRAGAGAFVQDVVIGDPEGEDFYDPTGIIGEDFRGGPEGVADEVGPRTQYDWTRGWIEAGLDPNYVAECSGAPSTSCMRNPYLPIQPAGAPDALATCLAGSGGDRALIESCFTTDDWANCVVFFQRALKNYGDADCDTHGYRDETIREGELLVSKNLPIWIQTNLGRTTAENGGNCPAFPVTRNEVSDSRCNAQDWQAPDDPNAAPRSDNDQSIFRGFRWLHAREENAATSEFVIRDVDNATGNVTFNITRLTQTLNLDPASPDYGTMLVKDGTYVVSVRAVDNTESFTSENQDKFPGVANDHCCWQDILLVVENDQDDDGVSDIREDWIKAKIQDSDEIGSMRSEREIQRADGSWQYADRHFDASSPFPDASDPASTEEDWDGDGVPNNLMLPNPAAGTGGPPFIRVDLEFQLNTDPLEADLPGEAGLCDVFGLSPAPRDEGSGVMGDRNNNCVPNVADTDKRIIRLADTDGDGYTDAEEAEAGSCWEFETPECRRSTPRDIDGDGIPNNFENFVDFVDQFLPADTCIDAQGEECPHGHNISVLINQGGITHAYVDHSGDFSSFSVGFAYEGAAPEGCPRANDGHCEVIGNRTLTDAVFILNDALRDIEEQGNRTRRAVDNETGGATQVIVGAFQNATCASGAPSPANGTCHDGHFATISLGGSAGIQHVFVDRTLDTSNPTGFTLVVGLHHTGTAPAGCTAMTGKPNHCSLGTIGGPGALNPNDFDGDGYTNAQELAGANPEAWSNPFYNRSTPDDPNTPEDENGFSFLADWDADRNRNEGEVGKSDPFQKCSTPPNPNGWSPTNPSPNCE